jgi:hypothetical protein
MILLPRAGCFRSGGIKPRSLHHDISTLTGEEVVLFTPRGPPQFRASKRK